MESIQLLCAADIHLGRQVGSLKGGASQVILAWERLIERCLDPALAIDLLILAGDLIDKGGLFIEMHGLLRKGVRRLLDRGIQVVAIAGNHDAGGLAALSRALGLLEFCVLGATGEWERKSFFIRGRKVHIDGYSFTQAHLLDNPLTGRSWSKEGDSDVLIGLLHCDVDVPKSPYAPVRSSDFEGLPHAAWILGHVHIPKKIRAASPWVHYCGSLQGLDVTETGLHGAWKLTINGKGEVASEYLPLAPLQWEQLTLDLSQITLVDWEKQLLHKMEEEMAARAGKTIESMGVRWIFTGSTEIYHELRQHIGKFEQQIDAEFKAHGRWITYVIESIQNHTRPQWDLESLAKGRHMVATVARRLLQAEAQDFSSYVQARWREDSHLKQCPVDLVPWTEEEYRAMYLNQGYALLDELLRQAREER